MTPTDSVDTPRIYIENGDSTYVTAGTGTVNGVSTAINGINSAASLSEDSRDSSSSISYTPKPRGRGFRGRPPWKGRGRGRPRGAYSMDPELRRKNKLKEVCALSFIFSLILFYLRWGTAIPTILHVCPAKTQISLHICTVWSESSLAAWRLIKLCWCTGWSVFIGHTFSLVGNAVARAQLFKAKDVVS